MKKCSSSIKLVMTPFIHGFTLIELMVTIAIAGIITAIALPNLNEFTVKMRVDNEVSEIQRLLLLARNSAINTGADASLCPLTPADICINVNADPAPIADWEGRIGVVTIDGLIKERAGTIDNDKLEFPNSIVTYSATGQLSTAAGTFSYCPHGHSSLSRGVELSISGRSMLTADNDNDGVDEDRDNHTITCS